MPAFLNFQNKQRERKRELATEIQSYRDSSAEIKDKHRENKTESERMRQRPERNVKFFQYLLSASDFFY